MPAGEDQALGRWGEEAGDSSRSLSGEAGAGERCQWAWPGSAGTLALLPFLARRLSLLAWLCSNYIFLWRLLTLQLSLKVS